MPNTWYIEPQGLLAEALSERTGLERPGFFCNSGTEANEAAIKLARLHGKPGAGTRSSPTLNSFHGRTMGALTATGQPKYHEGVEPMLAGFHARSLRRPRRRWPGPSTTRRAPSWSSRSRARAASTCPPPATSKGLRELADQHQLDAHLRRSPDRHGPHRHLVRLSALDGVEPDALTLAKALAGGVAWAGCWPARSSPRSFVPGTHAATFGGNPIACRGGTGHHRDHRGRRPAEASPGDRRAVSRPSSRRCGPAVACIKDVRVRAA